MRFSVDVRTNIDRAIVEVQKLREDVKEKAAFRAINRTLDRVATQSGREIRKEYNIKQRAIMSALSKRRAYKGKLFGRLIVEGVKLGLIEFDARSRRKVGASVKIKVKGGRQVVAGSFIATRRWASWQNGAEQSHRGVFKRVGKERLPIKYLRSVSVPQAFINKAVVSALEKLAVYEFDKNYIQQIRFFSGGGR